MKPAHYILVRYAADLARGEALNVGIIVWDESGYRMRVDDDAVARVLWENPHLESDALSYLEPYLRAKFDGIKLMDEASVQRILDNQQIYTLILSESRYTTVSDSSNDEISALDATLGRLISAIVHPRRPLPNANAIVDVHQIKSPRSFGSEEVPAIEEARDKIEQVVVRLVGKDIVKHNYSLATSKSGRLRTVDFYANHGANLALDVVRLSYKQKAKILEKADAEAYKVVDIMALHDLRYIVYCEFSQDEAFRSVNNDARQVIESAGAKVVQSVAEAHEAVSSAVTRQLSL